MTPSAREPLPARRSRFAVVAARTEIALIAASLGVAGVAAATWALVAAQAWEIAVAPPFAVGAALVWLRHRNEFDPEELDEPFPLRGESVASVAAVTLRLVPLLAWLGALVAATVALLEPPVVVTLAAMLVTRALMHALTVRALGRYEERRRVRLFHPLPLAYVLIRPAKELYAGRVPERTA